MTYLPIPCDSTSNWSPVQFKDVCSKVTDNTQPLPNGTRLYIGLEHIASGFPKLISYGIESSIKSSKTVFKSGDILYGKLRPYLRKSVLAEQNGMCSTDILVFRAKQNCHVDYLCYLTHWGEFVKHAVATTSGVQHPRTSWSSLSKFNFCLPPLAEQRKIAAVLNLVQQAIEQQERLIDLTTELKKALMHKLFTEGLRGEPQKETEIGLIPKSWRVDSMESFISNSKYGLSIKGQDSGSIPILRMTNQVDGYIDTHNLQYVDIPNDVLEKYRVCRGDLLFNRTNSFELVGRTALFDIDGDFVFASYLIRITVDMQQMMPEFINFYLNWDKTQQRLKSIATRSVSQSNISASRLGKFLVALPPMDEQLALVNVFQTLDDKRKLHLRNRSLLVDLFQTLLHQLMTAQIRVNALDLSGLEEQLKE